MQVSRTRLSGPSSPEPITIVTPAAAARASPTQRGRTPRWYVIAPGRQVRSDSSPDAPDQTVQKRLAPDEDHLGDTTCRPRGVAHAAAGAAVVCAQLEGVVARPEAALQRDVGPRLARSATMSSSPPTCFDRCDAARRIMSWSPSRRTRRPQSMLATASGLPRDADDLVADVTFHPRRPSSAC